MIPIPLARFVFAFQLQDAIVPWFSAKFIHKHRIPKRARRNMTTAGSKCVSFARFSNHHWPVLLSPSQPFPNQTTGWPSTACVYIWHMRTQGLASTAWRNPYTWGKRYGKSTVWECDQRDAVKIHVSLLRSLGTGFSRHSWYMPSSRRRSCGP